MQLSLVTKIMTLIVMHYACSTHVSKVLSTKRKDGIYILFAHYRGTAFNTIMGEDIDLYFHFGFQ